MVNWWKSKISFLVNFMVKILQFHVSWKCLNSCPLLNVIFESFMFMKQSVILQKIVYEWSCWGKKIHNSILKHMSIKGYLNVTLSTGLHCFVSSNNGMCDTHWYLSISSSSHHNFHFLGIKIHIVIILSYTSIICYEIHISI